MEVHTRQADAVLVVALEGELDAYWAEETQRELWDCLERGHHRLVLDLSRLSYLSSAGLRVLFDALNEMPRETGYSRRREMLRSFIDRWQKEGNRFAVSCRVLDYTGGELSGLQQVEIERLPVGRVGEALVSYLPDKGPSTPYFLWKKSPERRFIK